MSTPPHVRLEWQIFFVRWAGIVFMVPALMLLPIGQGQRQVLLGIVAFAALYNASVPLLIRKSPRLLLPVMAFCDAVTATSYVFVSGFGTQAYFALFWTAISTAFRLGLTATLVEIALLAGVDIFATARAGEFSPGAWLFRTICLGMMGALAAILYEYAQGVNERLRTANADLVQMSQAQTAFLNNASHELRTPLTSIRSFSEFLLDSPEITDDAREFAGIINEESERMTRLVSNLLDLGRLEAGAYAWRTEAFDIRPELEEIVLTQSPVAADKGLMLGMDVVGNLPYIEADKDAIRQVLVNLVGNAIKFTSHGYVRIRAWMDGARVAISVEDSGPGISDDDQARIFDRFYRVSSSVSGNHSGSGLGLAICKEILEHHGSDIRVSSAAGQGSQFAFSLPAVSTRGGS